MSDDEVIVEIDRMASTTEVGARFWYDELTRRHLERSSKRLERLTWAILALTAANVATVIAATAGG